MPFLGSFAEAFHLCSIRIPAHPSASTLIPRVISLRIHPPARHSSLDLSPSTGLPCLLRAPRGHHKTISDSGCSKGAQFRDPKCTHSVVRPPVSSTFPSSQTELGPHDAQSPHRPPPAPHGHRSTLPPHEFDSCLCHGSGILQHFCARRWLIPLSPTERTGGSPVLGGTASRRVYISRFLSPSVRGHFYLQAVRNRAATNTCVQIPV